MRWSNKTCKKIELVPLVVKLSFDVLANAAYSMPIDVVKEGDGIGFMLAVQRTILRGADLVRNINANIMDKLPTRANKVFKDDVQTIVKAVDDLIEKRKAGKLVPRDKGRDLLDIMMAEEINMSLEEIRSSVFTFFAAGHETTASTAAAAIYMLGKYPEFQGVARLEVDEVVGSSLPRADDVKKLLFLDKFLKEVMRVVGATSALIPRTSGEDLWIDDVCLPAGTILTGSIYAVHHSKEFWPNPEIFDPYRFSEEKI